MNRFEQIDAFTYALWLVARDAGRYAWIWLRIMFWTGFVGLIAFIASVIEWSFNG